MTSPNLSLAMALAIAGTVACAATSAVRPAHADAGDGEPDGPLDLPLPDQGSGASGEGGAVVDAETLQPAPGVTDQASLEREVLEEQEALEELGRGELEERAEEGERGAQVVLGGEFAREAESLAFAPAAANDALSDAVRWYSLAASRGFPGAPPLDQPVVEFHPVRIQRPPP